MDNWKCKLLTVWYTIRYVRDGEGHILLGHDFKYEDKVHLDHWHVKCRRCGFVGAVDVAPNRI